MSRRWNWKTAFLSSKFPAARIMKWLLRIMTDGFGDSVTRKQIQGVFDRKKQRFKVENPSEKKKKRKVLNGGLEYAKSLCSKTE